jgi:hypothetical protein
MNTDTSPHTRRNSLALDEYWPEVAVPSEITAAEASHVRAAMAAAFQGQEKELVTKHEEAAELGRQHLLAMLFIALKIFKALPKGLDALEGGGWKGNLHGNVERLHRHAGFVSYMRKTGRLRPSQLPNRTAKADVVKYLAALELVLDQEYKGKPRMWGLRDTAWVFDYLTEYSYTDIVDRATRLNEGLFKKGPPPRMGDDGSADEHDASPDPSAGDSTAPDSEAGSQDPIGEPAEASGEKDDKEPTAEPDSPDGDGAYPPPTFKPRSPKDNDPRNDPSAQLIRDSHQDLIDVLDERAGKRAILVFSDGFVVKLWSNRSGRMVMIDNELMTPAEFKALDRTFHKGEFWIESAMEAWQNKDKPEMLSQAEAEARAEAEESNGLQP